MLTMRPRTFIVNASAHIGVRAGIEGPVPEISVHLVEVFGHL